LAPRQLPYVFAMSASQIIFGYQFANLLVIGLQCSALGKLSLLLRTLVFKPALVLRTLEFNLSLLFKAPTCEAEVQEADRSGYGRHHSSHNQRVNLNCIFPVCRILRVDVIDYRSPADQCFPIPTKPEDAKDHSNQEYKPECDYYQAP
jgi:hypothetical protein